MKERNNEFAPDKVTTRPEDIANDPDYQVVVIATTEAGKHIYVEKPWANNFEEMFAIVE